MEILSGHEYEEQKDIRQSKSVVTHIHSDTIHIYALAVDVFENYLNFLHQNLVLFSIVH